LKIGKSSYRKHAFESNRILLCYIFTCLKLWNSLSYPTDAVLHCWSDCRQILLASEIMVCVGILLSFHIISPYTVPQYVCSGLILFVSAEVLEGEELFNSSVLLVIMNVKKGGIWKGAVVSSRSGKYNYIKDGVGLQL